MKKFKKSFLDSKETLSLAKSKFFYRQKQLIAELAYIYPIKVCMLKRLLIANVDFFISILNYSGDIADSKQ